MVSSHLLFPVVPGSQERSSSSAESAESPSRGCIGVGLSTLFLVLGTGHKWVPAFCSGGRLLRVRRTRVPRGLERVTCWSGLRALPIVMYLWPGMTSISAQRT